jgi:hypothetical protein
MAMSNPNTIPAPVEESLALSNPDTSPFLPDEPTLRETDRRGFVTDPVVEEVAVVEKINKVSPPAIDPRDMPSVGEAVSFHYDDRGQRINKQAVIAKIHSPDLLDLKLARYNGQEEHLVLVPRSHDDGAVGDPVSWTRTPRGH